MTESILVTGGSGFIGTYVTEQLLRQGYHVLVLDHSLEAKPSVPGVTQFWGDVRDAVVVTEAMSHAGGFIHLAGVLGTAETIQNPKPAIMTNLEGGLNVLEAATQYKIPGVNIAVGNYWENNPYSISKNSVERLALMYAAHRGTAVTNVRALNAYGPRQSVAAPYGNSKVRKIVPSFIMRALNGDPIEVYGDGLQVMDMVHVRDVAEILVDVLGATMYSGAQPTVEAGTGINTTVLDVAQAVATMVPNTKIHTLPMRPGESASRPVVADLKTLEPYYPNGFAFISLRAGLDETIRYYENTLVH